MPALTATVRPGSSLTSATRARPAACNRARDTVQTVVGIDRPSTSVGPVPEYRAPIGTFDVLPPESGRWEALVARFSVDAERAGFGLILQPLFEDYEVFS